MKKGIDYTGISIVYFCHDGSNRFLLNKRSKLCRDEQGKWDVGGGSLEFGDDVEKRLKQEILEEYCTKVISYELLGFRDVHRVVEGQSTHWLALDFKVWVNPDTVANGEPHKFDEIGWFSLDSLPSPLHSQLYKSIRKYKSRLITRQVESCV